MSHHLNLVVCLLTARTELPRVWGRFDHERPNNDFAQVLLVAGVAVLAAALILLWYRLSGRSSKDFASNSPRLLFRELCHAHGLSFADRRLLKRLAAAHGAASPAVLFVEPHHFDAARLPDHLQASAAELERLHARLFGAAREMAQ